LILLFLRQDIVDAIALILEEDEVTHLQTMV